MILTSILPVALATVWYGPVQVSFDAALPGNPYDPAVNDVRVDFAGPQGKVERRLAYYDDGVWRAWLVARVPGSYRARLVANGKPVDAPAQTVRLDSPMKDGFVRLGGAWGFQFDSGRLYWPVGHNLGWQSPGQPDMAESIRRLGAIGGNWSRIWACHWDGKNPWWPDDSTVELPAGTLWPKALKRWDDLVAASEKSGVHFQFTLFHHGQWTTRTNPNWGENPWNTARGGFLKDPADFFVDPEAKRRSKIWLRHAVARWGHSPAVMAWELFNEVEWVNAVVDKREAEVGAWHDEMADYVRSLDSYDHLVTTSSGMELPIWRKADYDQPHGYPPSVEAMVLAFHRKGGRPGFFGEIGPGDLSGGPSVQTQAIRDGIWAGLFAQHSGAGQFWTWDIVHSQKLLPEFRRSIGLLKASRVLEESGLKRIAPEMDAGIGGDLRLQPGGGWATTTRFAYDLPADAATEMGTLMSYFQGKAHAEMRREPVAFRFRAAYPGKFVARVGGAASSGGNLVLRVNGKEAARAVIAGGGSRLAGREVAAEFPAGPVEVVLDNDGADWVLLTGLTVTGIAPRASAMGLGNARMAVVRIRRSVPEPVSIRPGALPVADGSYTAVLADLAADGTQRTEVVVQGGRADRWLELKGLDNILILRRR